MTEYKIQSTNFIPDNLRDLDFYKKTTEILDYVLDLYHTKNIDVLKALYDIKNEDFDVNKILELLGSKDFVDFDVDEEQFKTLCALLSNLYEIKGTKRGLQYLLRLLDMDCKIYEWYDINKWYQQGDPKWTQPVDPCTIVIELGMEHKPIGVCDRYDKWALPRTGSPAEEMLGENQAFEDTEGKFRDFATKLLWVCVSLAEIRWSKILVDYVDIQTTFHWEAIDVFYNKYSPFVFNCPDTIQVGFPLYQEYPLVGDDVNVGDFRYKQQAFLVRSQQEYNDPINYDGWDNSGTVGYSKQIISESPPLVGNNLKVGQNGYFWEWGYSESAQKEYLLLQRVLVGELWIEGNISPVNQHRVSGCKVSVIETLKETGFENDFHIRRGIIVGQDDVVLPAENIGNSYVVDDHQGDILEMVAVDSSFIEEKINPAEESALNKELDFSSNISELYSQFTVGDGSLVGDTNLFVGFDYFVTHFEAIKETDFSEQFYFAGLQVGSFGHYFSAGTPYSYNIGDYNVGNSNFVGATTTPAEYKERHLTLTAGTFLFVGSEITVSPAIKVGQGLNYVGELPPWDNSNFITNSNVIYEWLEYSKEETFVEEEILAVDQLDSNTSDTSLSSNIRDSIWNKVVGEQNSVGNLQVEDNYSILNLVEYTTGDLIEDVGLNTPVVQPDPYNYTIEKHSVGNNSVGENIVGGFDINVEDPNTILGIRHLSTLFVGNATVGRTSFNKSLPIIPAYSSLVCFVDDGEDPEINLEDSAISNSSLDINTFGETQDYAISNSLIQEEIKPEIQETFNVNEEITLVVLGSEDNNVLILNPEGNETNPVYLSAEQTELYTYDPQFNFTNAINDSLFYLIDED
jgi:hypothetical protein